MKFKDKIIFLNWDNWYMKIIRLHNLYKYGEKGYAHVGIITKEKDGLVQIHEAIGEGFIKSWYPKDFIENKIADGSAAVKQSKIELIDVEKNADKYLGRGYAWFDIFSIFICFVIEYVFCLPLKMVSKIRSKFNDK